MESGKEQVDESQLNIQNDYFNQARREKRRLAVFLTTGRRLTGRTSRAWRISPARCTTPASGPERAWTSRGCASA